MGSVLFVCLGGGVGDYVWAVYCLYAWAVVLVITYGQCTVSNCTCLGGGQNGCSSCLT